MEKERNEFWESYPGENEPEVRVDVCAVDSKFCIKTTCIDWANRSKCPAFFQKNASDMQRSSRKQRKKLERRSLVDKRERFGED